jgi:chorismate dehydratase
MLIPYGPCGNLLRFSPDPACLVGKRREIYNRGSESFEMTDMSNVRTPSTDLRIGAVSYLNTKPLVHGLAELLPEAEIVFDYPSRLADALAVGDLDIALVPVAETWSHPQWSLVSDACIACRGPVLSVKLLFRVSPGKVRTLALDEGSRTSAVLSQILLKELAGVTPRISNLPLGCEPAEVSADAVLVIGDRAIRCREKDFVEVWDLGDKWCRATELPFVFAAWFARPGVDTEQAAIALASARNRGCEQVAAIAREQAGVMQLPLELVEEYLTKNLHFCLGSRERRGLELFHEKTVAHRLVQSVMEVSCKR